jgi:hypothetical protein
VVSYRNRVASQSLLQAVRPVAGSELSLLRVTLQLVPPVPP